MQDIQLSKQQKSWCIEQAEEIITRFPNATEFILETGFGPTGDPHLGTLIENVRTVMIANALRELDSRPVKVICIADDLDALRKVPTNIPNQGMLHPFVGISVSKAPDPFGHDDSFATRNINRLQKLINAWDLDVTIIRSSDLYRSGAFDQALLKILKHHSEVLDIIIPTLGEERRKTYSPFLPICPNTGKVFFDGVVEYRASTIVYNNGSELVEIPVTGGNCKLQWKIDLGMRWAALGVHYEMYGKDLISTAQIAGQVSALISHVPVLMMYEHFLNDEGAKISKSKGNSNLDPESWIRIAPAGSLLYFAYQNPVRAKRIDVLKLPAHVDNFIESCKQNDNIYINTQYKVITDISYQMLIQLAVIAKATPQIVESMLQRQGEDITDQIRDLIKLACNFAHDVILQNRVLAPLTEEWEVIAMKKLQNDIQTCEITPEALQTLCYQIGKEYAPTLKLWFQVIYRTIFGSETGPRIGTFLAYAGRDTSLELVQDVLDRKRLL